LGHRFVKNLKFALIIESGARKIPVTFFSLTGERGDRGEGKGGEGR
jgi:hypothetical protein